MKHRIHYPARGEKQPEATACLFHPTIVALTKKTVRDTKTDKYYQYGLCKECEGELVLHPRRFAREINNELEKVLADVYKNKGG
jgi:hypothetical protein